MDVIIRLSFWIWSLVISSVTSNEIVLDENSAIIRLDWWKSPCLTPALPIDPVSSLIPDERSTRCTVIDFASDRLTLIDDSISVKERTCFYDAVLRTEVVLQLFCQDEEIISEKIFVNIEHPMLKRVSESKNRRKKVKRALSFDNAIHFDLSSYSVNVTEEGSPHQIVLDVQAYNPDRLPLFYNLIATQDTRSNSLFQINRTTGQISTTRSLDRETMGRHVFRVTAYEGGGGNPSRSASAAVVINVVDVNDHSPLFEKSVYVATISESADIGTTVLHVHAQDDDSEQNGEVSYSIVDGDDRREFYVDPKSGVLKIRRPLDREALDFYRLKVRACDKARPEPRCSDALVEITVEDENDNGPQFVEAKFAADVAENIDASKKPVIAKIKATDADAADNAKIHYSIVSGNVANRFSIDYHTGDVRLLEKLNYKQNAQYELVVRAQDSGSVSMSNTTLLVVHVVDVNDNAPRFYTAQFQEAVSENVPVGYNIMRLQAYDADNGANAEIRYSLMHPDKEKPIGKKFPLVVDPVSGWVSVTEALDREKDTVFDFYVTAIDNGVPPLSSSVRVIINVLDVNDNAPTFEHRFYNVSVLENVPRGSEILRVKANDKDEASTRLDYSISAGNDDQAFTLLNQGDIGLLTVNDKLDYKLRSAYTISVKAIDAGGYYDTALVYIYVVDVNSPPYFVRDRFQLPISENHQVNTTVDIVQASDNDEGDNALISYALDGGQDYFRIDNRTGLITVSKPLDREAISKFNLLITARDNGNPPLAASTELEVVIEDVNDNAPKFQHFNYTTSISEDLAVGTSFMSITALDNDSGANGRVSYHFSQDTVHNESFYIDATSGTIRISKSLDREQTSEYFLYVLAIDKGTPSMTGTTTVHIILTDVNDNAPKFDSDTYRFYIPENRPSGTVVGRIRAVDPDSALHSSVVYKIFGGADMSLFELSTRNSDNGADVIIRAELDFESKKNLYHFQVQASSGDLSSVSEVYVQVQDVNDHAPIFQDFFLVFNNYPDYFPMAPPGMTPAYDPDFNDSLTYWIDAGNEANLLSVDADTGQLTLNANANTNRQIDAKLRICVSDGVNKVCATCTLRVTPVTEEMLLNSLTLRAKGVTVHSFLNPAAYSRFVDAAATLLPSHRDDVFVFSVRDDGVVQSEHYLNISLSIRRPYSDQFVGAGELQELVHLNREVMSNIAHIDLLPFEDNLCVREPCLNFERCQNVLKFGEASDFVTTDNFLFRPIHPINTFMCVCPEGFAGMSKQFMCDTEINLCYSSPCGPNATCVSKEGGYTCQCPPNFTGSKCEFSMNTDFCIPGLCGGTSKCDVRESSLKCVNCQYPSEFSTKFCQLKARSFYKNSYVTFQPLHQRFRFEISLSFSTTSEEGLLFYNGRYHPDHDFISLTINNGNLNLQLSLGSSQVVALTLSEENAVNDGQWHTVKINYYNRTVTMSLGNCDEEIALLSNTRINYPKCATRKTLPLENRCSDPTVTCYRFLDLSGPLYVGGLPDGDRAKQFRVKSSSFEGCMKDFFVDNELVDFGRFVVNRGTDVGCKHLNDRCEDQRPCEYSKRCRNIWNGYKCDCVEDYDGRNCSNEVGPTLRLTSDESYVSYKVPSNFPMPFVLGVSFKTRQHTSTLLTAEFTGRRQISFKIWNKKPRIAYGGDPFTLTYPNLSDALWHTVTVTVVDNRLNVTIDFVHTETFSLSETFYGGLTKIYVGAAPEANFPQPFLGCIKAPFLSRSLEQVQYLKIDEQYLTEFDCEMSNPCLSNSCPESSICVQDWDTFVCRCLPGFVGDKCIDVCQLNPCKNNGTCQKTVLGYHCLCSKGFTGKHCETSRITAGDQCPKNWWGYPMCGPCKCDGSKGYDSDCKKTTGKCQCKTLNFKPEDSDVCLPCNCYYPHGSTSMTCHAITGQCPCKGDAQGRRCNLCQDPRAQINKTSGKCEIIDGSCPESYASETVWRLTTIGANSVQSCPQGSVGLATRMCTNEQIWAEPKLINCTSKRYEPLNNLLTQLDNDLDFNPYLAKKVALQLKNVSVESDSLLGRDMYISYRLLSMLLRNEVNSASNMQLSHLQDKRFIDNIVTSTSVMFDRSNVHWWNEMFDDHEDAVGHLMKKLHDYGLLVAQSLKKSYTKPFRIATKNIIFAIDSLKSNGAQRIVLPKFDNFLFIENMGDVRIDLPTASGRDSASVVFYSTFKTAGQLMSNYIGNNPSKNFAINGPVLSLVVLNASNSVVDHFSEPILTSFLLNNPVNSTNPHCVWWQQPIKSKGTWKSDGCYVLSKNESHVICSCNHLSLLAVVTEIGDYTFNESTDFFLPYFSLICAVFSSILLFGCMIIQCYSNGLRYSNMQSIFKSVCISFMVVIVAFVFVTRANDHEIACRLVSVVLEFFYLALFIWILLGPVHLYRIITEIKDVENSSSLIYCLIGWGFPALISGLSMALRFASHNYDHICWLSLNDYYVWLMVGPIGLCVLLTLYMSGLCALIGYSKEWDVLSSKLNFRSELFTATITEFACIAVWLLALMSVNMQRLELHYCYHAMSLLTAILVAYLVCHEGIKLNKNVKKAYFWISKEIPEEMTTSKSVGGVSGEDPSATVSRPESPDIHLSRNRNVYNSEDMDDEEDANETTALSSAVNGSSAGYFRANDKAYHSSNDLNRPTFFQHDVYSTLNKKNVDYQNNSRPDLIPSWEQSLNSITRQISDVSPISPTYASAYGTSRYGGYRRPLLMSSSKGILSPVQKVLSDTESNVSTLGRESPSKLITFCSSPRRTTANLQTQNESQGGLPQKCFTADELSCFNVSTLGGRKTSHDSVL